MTTESRPAAARPVVIVVDDDPAVRNSLSFSLGIEGFAVREFADGAELLKGAQSCAADCLLIGEQMPGMSALDVVARLRERNILVPTILMASRLTPALLERATRAGVCVVEKPLLGNVLLERIRGLLAPAIVTGC
jgi:two-component system, LuxR family, response regulator FixJ